MEERRQEKQESQGTLAGYWLSRWPSSHVLSAEGCLCQQHRPSYWLQQLSNICSLALTDEKGPVKMGWERTTRYVTLLILRSWYSIEQSVVCWSCSGSATCLLHARQCRQVTWVGNVSTDQGICFVCHATSMSAVLKVFLFMSLFWGLRGSFLSDSLCVWEMCQRNDYKALTRKNTAHPHRCYDAFCRQNQLDQDGRVWVKQELRSEEMT